ncbi:hypothetical protein [Chroococcidiopsis sp. SAG 2025]|nr:hypothetical protein [Chroococcidiopsis sp. SAG 2025]
MAVLQSRGETIALLQHYYRGRSLSVKILSIARSLHQYQKSS